MSKKKNNTDSQPALFKDAGLKLPTTHYERKWRDRGYDRVAGVDEVGRGPLAGPVVAAAVILPDKIGPRSRLRQLRDSKVLKPEKRDELFELIHQRALSVGWAMCSHDEIDELNILKASLEAMRRAVMSMTELPQICLVDGNMPLPGSLPSVPIIKGDSKSLSIAAASIVAKVTRDRMMLENHKLYPHYYFDSNKGYPTQEHRQALIKHGPCPIHRKTFRGVKELLNNDNDDSWWSDD